MAGFDINFGLLGPNNAGNALLAGYERGQQTRRESDQRNALASYATQQTPENLARVAQFDPGFAMQESRRLQVEQARQHAAGGDRDALSELAALDPVNWARFDDATRERVKQATSFLGNAALDVSRAPEEQRAAKWTQYVQAAEANGMDIPDHLERYSPEALQGAMAEAGKVEAWIRQSEPDYRAIPQGGGLVDVHNPAAIEAWNSGPGAPQPQQQQSPPPPPGFVIDQHGGPAPGAPGTFP